MSEITDHNYYIAARDFQQARRRADMRRLIERMTGRSSSLLSFEEVRDRVAAVNVKERRLQEVPLDAIIGSVGRYADFTRDFLPLRDSDEARWARVMAAVTRGQGLDPIEVYKIGDAYFVLDGNHRVSVSRQLGSTHIQAYVTEMSTRVPLTPDMEPDELIIQAELVDFLDRTGLKDQYPKADFTVTAPGRYDELVEQIQVAQYELSEERGAEVSMPEAAACWHDERYLPVVRLIRRRGVLRHFPGRTETDLYAWIVQHREELEESLGWTVSPQAAAHDLASQFSRGRLQRFARLGKKLLNSFRPAELEAGPPPGRWREEHEIAGQEDCLFSHLLVPISGQEKNWNALEQAFEVAHREPSRIHALHVVGSKADLDSKRLKRIETEFEKRCQRAGIEGDLGTGVGPVAKVISRRSRLVDLIVVSLFHPPALRPLARLGSGIHTLLQQTSRPLLAVPGKVSPLKRALLAFDGSPKAQEALYISTYLAAKWGMQLVVLSVVEADGRNVGAIRAARTYLDSFGIDAKYVRMRGDVSQTILQQVEQQDCDLIVMGGFGHSPVLEVVLGSAVDGVMRHSQQPILICR